MRVPRLCFVPICAIEPALPELPRFGSIVSAAAGNYSGILHPSHAAAAKAWRSSSATGRQTG
jgi:hypothetical protein